MHTITGEEVHRGDRLTQVVQKSLGMLPSPVVVQIVDEEHHGIVVGNDLNSEPLTNLDGSVRVYSPGQFIKTH